jgi:hypothetical protein
MELQMDQVFHLATVITAQIALLIFPSFVVARRCAPDRNWPGVIFVALVMSLAAQGTAGMLWDHRITASPNIEAVVYMMFWLLATLVCFRKPRGNSFAKEEAMNVSESSAIAGILVLAFVVRSIHPLRHWALGQSDAYSHLQFLDGVIRTGRIGNDIYPPGYHWVMALPSLIFSVDAYYLARYGGAFFGLALVLGIYVLGRTFASKSAALFGAFFVAAFPGLQLLLKTGVGSFANQMGLCLIPAVVLFYFQWRSNGFAWCLAAVMLAVSLLAMASAVPMMLLHVLLLLAFERAVSLAVDKRSWMLASAKVALATLPAVALLAFHTCDAGLAHRAATMKILTNADAADMHRNLPVVHQTVGTAQTSPVWLPMTIDFVSIKRIGYGHGAVTLNLVAIALSAFFLAYLVAGIVRRNQYLLAIGLWGVFASVQAHTGFLQFSNYQREGWSLLIAVACMGGHISSVVYSWVSRWFIARAACVLAVLLVAAWCLAHPPEHTLFSSPAEDEIVQLVRTVSGQEKPAISSGIGGAEDADVLSCLSPGIPVCIVSRRFAGFKGGQGDVIRAVKGNLKSVTFTGAESAEQLFKPGSQYVVVIDRDNGSAPRGYEVMQRVNHELTQRFLDERSAALQLNDALEGRINRLDTHVWNIRRFKMSRNLGVVVATPLAAEVLQKE